MIELASPNLRGRSALTASAAGVLHTFDFLFLLRQVFVGQVVGAVDDVRNLVLDPGGSSDLLLQLRLQLLQVLLAKIARIRLKVFDFSRLDFGLLQDLGRDLELLRHQLLTPLVLENFFLDVD